MTKEKELQILQKIDDLINEAGPDSYIGMTFAGTVELTKENITNDFGSNYKEMYENEQERARILSEGLNELRQQTEGKLTETTDELNKYKTWCEKKDNRIDELNNQISEAADDIGKYIDDLHAEKAKTAALEAEIITLKAKLYDLMTA